MKNTKITSGRSGYAKSKYLSWHSVLNSINFFFFLSEDAKVQEMSQLECIGYLKSIVVSHLAIYKKELGHTPIRH